MKLLNLVYPPKCAFCGKLMATGADFERPCPECAARLPLLTPAQSAKYEPGLLCVAPLAYREPVTRALKNLKFNNRLSGVRYIASLMRAAVAAHAGESFDFITWTPLSIGRLHRRGYNQSKLLARELGRMMGIPCRATLVKLRKAPPQSSLGHDDYARLMNAKGAYGLFPFVSPKGKRILLVDDIVTSGATLAECAKQFVNAGASLVVCVTAARARP